MEHDRDDEPLSFSQLGLQTALIINRIRNAQMISELAKENEKQPEENAGRSRSDEERAADELAYVEQRLRELAIWERRISGDKKLGT